MTPDELIACADLMRRYAESAKAGKPIEIQYQGHDGSWVDDDNPDFATHVANRMVRWRQKPREPRRWRLVRADKYEKWEEWPYLSSAIHPDWEIIEVVEVLHD